MIEKLEIVPGLGNLQRNDFYGEAVRLLPDGSKEQHIAMALSLSRARMLGEAQGYDRCAADLQLMADRLRGSSSVLWREKVA